MSSPTPFSPAGADVPPTGPNVERQRRSSWLLWLILVGIAPILLLCSGVLAVGIWYQVQQSAAARAVEEEVVRIQTVGEPITSADLHAYHRIPDGVVDATPLWQTALRSYDEDKFNADYQSVAWLDSRANVPLDDAQQQAARAFLEKYQSTVDATLAAAQAGGQTLALYAYGDRIYAVDNRCPHMGFPLSQGTVKDGILTCHWHHARFDLASGGTFDQFADDVRAYPVELRGEELWIDLAPRHDERAHQLKRLRDGLERGRHAVEEGAATAERMAQGVADGFGQPVEALGAGMQQAMQRSLWGAQAVMRSGSILAGGMQTISREWMQLASERLQRNAARMEGLTRCRTPQELWLLRNDAFQLIAQRHDQRTAAERIDALIQVFEGWLDPKQLARVR